MTARIGLRGLLATALAVVLVVAGCSSTSEADQAAETDKAEQLVAATQAAGVAPRLTVEVAESLYGTDATSVCDLLDDGLSNAAGIVILGNPAQGRRKTITDHAVEYGRLVVQTYCPDELDRYDGVVDDLDPFERNDR